MVSLIFLIAILLCDIVVESAPIEKLEIKVTKAMGQDARKSNKVKLTNNAQPAVRCGIDSLDDIYYDCELTESSTTPSTVQYEEEECETDYENQEITSTMTTGIINTPEKHPTTMHKEINHKEDKTDISDLENYDDVLEQFENTKFEKLEGNVNENNAPTISSTDKPETTTTPTTIQETTTTETTTTETTTTETTTTEATTKKDDTTQNPPQNPNTQNQDTTETSVMTTEKKPTQPKPPDVPQTTTDKGFEYGDSDLPPFVTKPREDATTTNNENKGDSNNNNETPSNVPTELLVDGTPSTKIPWEEEPPAAQTTPQDSNAAGDKLCNNLSKCRFPFGIPTDTDTEVTTEVATTISSHPESKKRTKKIILLIED